MRVDGKPNSTKGSAPQSPSSPHHPHSNGSSNGHSSPTMAKFTNGHSANAGLKLGESNGLGHISHKHSNGTSAGPKDLPPIWEGHLRAEVTRILVQSLTELGYHNTARTLSVESGYQVEGSLVSAFRNCVLSGDWTETERLLLGDWNKTNKGDDSNQGGLPLIAGANKKELVFWIRQQKYLELLEGRDLSNALVVLRQELTPLHQDSDRLHALGGLLMCPSADDLKAQANWDGASGESRRILLSELSRAISPTVMIPEHRLGNILDQVKQSWKDKCLFHNTTEEPSLYIDHICDRSDFPCYPDVSFNEHNGEVWYVAFSNRGRFLATAGSDKIVHVYEIQQDGFSKFMTLSEHGSGVCFLAWSPDDSKLLSCTRESDNRLRVMDITDDGQVICDIAAFTAPTTAACWLPDGETFVVSSLDTAHSIEIYSLDEDLIYRFEEDNLRVFDIALSPDNTRLVALTEQQIIVYDFVTKERVREYGLLDAAVGLENSRLIPGGATTVGERERERERDGEAQHRHRHGRTGSITHGGSASRDGNFAASTGGSSKYRKPCMTSISISRDSKYMLVSQNPNWIRMMRIDTGEEVTLFEGHRQEEFMIRSSWGGAHEGFVVSGSEDNKIYIWRATSGQLIERLEGHDKCVNCISWNPALPGMFASASDDGKVKVWYSRRLSGIRQAHSTGLAPREIVHGDGSSMMSITSSNGAGPA